MPFDFSSFDLPEYETGFPSGFGQRSPRPQFQQPERQNPWLALANSIKPQPMPGLDQYRSHVQNVPQMEQYSPSKWRRFGASLAGGLTGATQGAGKGYELARGIVEQPYRSAIENWGVQEQGLRQAASREIEDQKAQNQYMKNIFDAYVRSQETEGKTQRVGMQQGGATERENIKATSAGNIAARNAAVKKFLGELAAMTSTNVANIGATSREKVAGITAEAGKTRAEIAAGASRYGADQRRAGQEYTADRGVEGRGAQQGEKVLSNAQMEGLQQRAILELMPRYKNLFSEYGPIQAEQRNGQPTGKFILAQNIDEIDEEYMDNYLQFTALLTDYLKDAEKRLNTPQGTRINPPAGSNLPKIATPQVQKPRIAPPGSSSSSEWEDVPGVPGLQRRRGK